MTLFRAREVRRQAQDAMRIVTGQIGVDEGIGDDLGYCRLRANGAKKIAGETMQNRGVNVRHGMPIVCPRGERADRG